MNSLQQLALLTEALVAPVKEEKKFLAPVASYVLKLHTSLSSGKEFLNKQELVFLGEKIEEFFKRYRRTPNSGMYIPPVAASSNDNTVTQIFNLTKQIGAYSDEDFNNLRSQFSGTSKSTPSAAPLKDKKKCVFIGHGRSQMWLEVKEYIEKDLGIQVVSYESEPRTGESIVAVLEAMMAQATFAIIIMTAEDDTPDGTKRARQNVVHEAGLFQGRLGFTKAIVLLQRGCDDFSNIAGLQYLPFIEGNIDGTFHKLRKVLEREKQC